VERIFHTHIIVRICSIDVHILAKPKTLAISNSKFVSYRKVFMREKGIEVEILYERLKFVRVTIVYFCILQAHIEKYLSSGGQCDRGTDIPYAYHCTNM
jgi:hypothetical protein